ncbi:MAG TPA: hypothetical protein VFC56_04205 [Stellaceae bacterium]|nr:hypothetical protein [Stellaceae bacterium]
MPQFKRSISADEVRGGEVVLKKRWERVVFIAGLAGCAVLGVVLAFVHFWS